MKEHRQRDKHHKGSKSHHGKKQFRQGNRGKKGKGGHNKPLPDIRAKEQHRPKMENFPPSEFGGFPFPMELRCALTRMKFEKPTPIQEKVIPIALTGKDVVGIAQTGTGKTAAYLLPIISLGHRLASEGKLSGRPRILVLTPTRELALQVEDHCQELAIFMDFPCVAVFGGGSIFLQVEKLRKGSALVSATPGRLLDLLERKALSLDDISALVIDEADRMFDMGFLPDLRRIIALLPQDRQTLMFSATMPPPILQLAKSSLRNPERVEIQAGRLADGVDHLLIEVPDRSKSDLLVELLQNEKMPSVLVFTRTKRRADHLDSLLHSLGFASGKIHGELSQSARLRSLRDFREGRKNILIATDIAARGLDIDDISHVINYDVPGTPEDYVHRVGRTARGSKKGRAYTFASFEDRGGIQAIEKYLKSRIPRQVNEKFGYPPMQPKQPPQPGQKPGGGRFGKRAHRVRR